MSTIEITLPPMGEGIIEATITRWMVSVGDTVNEDQSLVEIATDKVDSEIPSPAPGRIKEILFNIGETPQIGQTLAILETESITSNEAIPTHTTATKVEKIAVDSKGSGSNLNDKKTEPSPHQAGLSPLVRTIIKQEGITDKEIEQVAGTGLKGRITRDDIIEYVSRRQKFTQHAPSQAASSSVATEVEVIHMDRMRKLIAEHMVYSKHTSAHVTSFIEADVTDLVNWRNKEKDPFEKREGQKLTFTPLFVEAAINAIKKYPLINSSVEGDKILVKRSINIGIAAALPNGNLIVPVIKGADKLSLAGLAERVNDLANRSRQNKLLPDEIQGGTFTITNLGMFETLTGTPIINQPQVAILAIGAITKRVVVMETPMGDTIAIRQIAMLSLSYDHRVVDGALGGLFLKEVRDNLQRSR